jgi:heptaprenyl diphosphate synthase
VTRSRDNFFTRNTNPLHLFITSALILPAYLFQDELLIRVGQVLAFAALSTVAGKKIKWMYFVIMVSSITFFNLLTPMGRVLVSVGPITITGGALRNGVMKGFTIIGLVFISLFSIRPDLRLPGRLGGLLVRLFYYFERIVETKRQKLEARRIIGSIDDILDSLYQPGRPQQPPAEAAAMTTAAGAVFMATAVAGNWALLLV